MGRIREFLVKGEGLEKRETAEKRVGVVEPKRGMGKKGH